VRIYAALREPRMTYLAIFSDKETQAQAESVADRRYGSESSLPPESDPTRRATLWHESGISKRQHSNGHTAASVRLQVLLLILPAACCYSPTLAEVEVSRGAALPSNHAVVQTEWG
jgi:hypothetical protein